MPLNYGQFSTIYLTPYLVIMFLSQWSYTKDEWKNFLNWKSRKYGKVFSMIRRIIFIQGKNAPEVKIATDRVWINNEHKPFQSRNRQFRHITIREENCINILEIFYEQENKIIGIKVPIPKGKLKEAFEVQQRLIMDNESVG
jgi:hypothetical protein